ncbi:MAG: hypothetical protein Q7T35_03575 [Nitrosomonas sp.]|nr:hypothetical protein [Nitrosomonas sp.]
MANQWKVLLILKQHWFGMDYVYAIWKRKINAQIDSQNTLKGLRTGLIQEK